MDTRRSFFGKLLTASGLLAISEKLFGASHRGTPRTVEAVCVLTEANSNIREIRDDHTVSIVDSNEMSQMDWLVSASGRPHGAVPWKNERCIPSHSPRLKRVPVFPDPSTWSGDLNS